MKSPAGITDRLGDYVRFIRGLYGTNSQLWFGPTRTGKWSIHDIIAHIMMWDRNFLETKMPKLGRATEADLEEDTDVQGFDDRAAAYGKNLSQDDLLDNAIRWRSELISQLEKLPSTAFDAGSRPKDSMSLTEFLQQMFLSHDQHHMKQIEDHLSHSQES